MAAASSATVVLNTEATDYGLGCSFPMDGETFTCDYEELLGDRRSVYREYMDGCRKKYGADRCDDDEARRWAENSRKPLSMVNYTETGFHQTRAPEPVMDWLLPIWEEHKNDNVPETDFTARLPRMNSWAHPSHFINAWPRSVELRDKAMPLLKQMVEEWTGMEQRYDSFYGIRKYTTGAILNPHVDRYPHTTAVIVNVDQDVDEPWPLEVIGRDGKAHNITLLPGDLLLYEPHSTIHGRPFALKGRFMANAFARYEITGRRIDANGTYYWKDGEEPRNGLPPYIIPGSPEESVWRQTYPRGWEHKDSQQMLDESRMLEGHRAAGRGNVERLRHLARHDPATLHRRDRRGWLPIHRAAHGAHQGAILLLIENGVDVNSVTDSGITPLDIVLMSKGKFNPLVDTLKERGALTRQELQQMASAETGEL